jgi:hypothetical protein
MWESAASAHAQGVKAHCASLASAAQQSDCASRLRRIFEPGAITPVNEWKKAK